MFQIDNDTSSQSLPAKTAAGTPGYFVDGDPAKGIPATILPAEFMNMLMMEFINLVTAAGLAPSKSDYTQLSQAIPKLIAKLATVDWSKVTNIPTDLLRANTAPALTGVELYGATPAVDFHFGSDASDYNVRVMNSADGQLRIINKAGTLAGFDSTAMVAYAPLLARKALTTLSQGAGASLSFNSDDNSKQHYSIQHSDLYLTLNNYPDGGGVSTALQLTRATGQLALAVRPVFNGATPWDTGNFNPANKADKATTLGGYGITDAATQAALDAVSNAKANKATTLAGYGINDAVLASVYAAGLLTKGPLPNTGGTTNPGMWQSFTGTLPAGGTWAWFCLAINASGNIGNYSAGVTSGGSNVSPTWANATNYPGFCWKVV